MSMLATANVSIAVGDLAAAASATAIMQLLSGGVNMQSFGKDLLSVGGATLIASQVADYIEPRIVTSIEDALAENFSAENQPLVLRFVTGTAISFGLFYAAGMVPGPLRATSAIPAVAVGISCLIGHYATTKYIESQNAATKTA